MPLTVKFTIKRFASEINTNISYGCPLIVIQIYIRVQINRFALECSYPIIYNICKSFKLGSTFYVIFTKFFNIP